MYNALPFPMPKYLYWAFMAVLFRDSPLKSSAATAAILYVTLHKMVPALTHQKPLNPLTCLTLTAAMSFVVPNDKPMITVMTDGKRYLHQERDSARLERLLGHRHH